MTNLDPFTARIVLALLFACVPFVGLCAYAAGKAKRGPRRG